MTFTAPTPHSRFRKRSKKLLVLILNAALYPLSVNTRRARDCWIFGHKGDVFAGNSKYLFLWMALHRPDIEVIWITGSEKTRRMLASNGYRVEKRWSWPGLLAAARAAVFIFSHDVVDVNGPLSRGSLHLNLWHGVGIKKLHVGRRPASSLFGRLRDFLIPPHDLVVATSDRMVEFFSGQFRIPPERCPQLGYPRLDSVADDALAKAGATIDQSAGFQLNPDGFKEVYLYAPTFRDTGRPFIARAFPDLDQLSRVLEERHALLYIKPHEQTLEEFPTSHANIRRWPDAIDFNSYLHKLDGLITDYSSVIYDYLLVRDTGVIVYTFDYVEYTSEDRQFVYPFEDNIAGLRVEDFAALCQALEQGTAFDPCLTPQAERIRERFWGGSSSPASPAVAAYVERELAARMNGARAD